MTVAAHRHDMRHGTAAAWTAANPVLALAEEGYETDTGQRKVGDDVTHWNDLPYQGSTGTAGTTANFQASWARQGVLAVEASDSRFYLEQAFTFAKCRIAVGTPPTSASIIVDILRNGTSIWHATPANRPTIAAGSNTAVAGAPDDTAYSSGDFFTVSIVQVGSDEAGADLTVVLYLTP